MYGWWCRYPELVCLGIWAGVYSCQLSLEAFASLSLRVTVCFYNKGSLRKDLLLTLSFPCQVYNTHVTRRNGIGMIRW